VQAITVPRGAGDYLVVDNGSTNADDQGKNNMITLTVLVIALGLAWAVNKAWMRAAEAFARKPAAPKAPEQAALF
jgi:hypothetical protein